MYGTLKSLSTKYHHEYYNVLLAISEECHSHHHALSIFQTNLLHTQDFLKAGIVGKIVENLTIPNILRLVD